MFSCCRCLAESSADTLLEAAFKFQVKLTDKYFRFGSLHSKKKNLQLFLLRLFEELCVFEVSLSTIMQNFKEFLREPSRILW